MKESHSRRPGLQSVLLSDFTERNRASAEDPFENSLVQVVRTHAWRAQSRYYCYGKSAVACRDHFRVPYQYPSSTRSNMVLANLPNHVKRRSLRSSTSAKPLPSETAGLADPIRQTFRISPKNICFGRRSWSWQHTILLVCGT